MSDARIIQTLPQGSWRGLLFPPHDTAPVGVKHRLAERKYPYIDVAGHDDVGADYSPMAFKLNFLNTTLRAAHSIQGRLYPDYYNRFLVQILDGGPGDLGHPLLGVVRARVESWHTEATINSQSGVILNITFVRTNENPGELELAADLSLGDPSRLAATADAKVAPFGIRFSPGLPAPMMGSIYGIYVEEPTLAQVWTALSARLSLDLSLVSAIASFIQGIIDMISALEALDDVLTWEALVALRRFWFWLDTAAMSLAQANRPTAQRVISSRTTLDAWARQTGMTLAQAMTLNVRFLRQPEIPAGSVLRFYRAA